MFNTEIPEFEDTAEVPVFYDITSKLLYKRRVIFEGILNISFIRKHKLNYDSNPADWYKVFISRSNEKYERVKCCIDIWCTYNNLKSMLINTGSGN